MQHPVVGKLHALRGVFARNSPGAHRRSRIIRQFAEKTGLIYFGSVDQHNDEHRVIRGITVSSSHKDTDYSVGTHEDYDVSLVSRQDLTESIDGSQLSHDWTLLEIQLKTTIEIPRILIQAITHTSALHTPLITGVTFLKPIKLGTFEDYPNEFLNRYAVYSSPSHAIEMQRLFPSAIARVIGAHFWPLSIEIFEQSVVIYSYKENVTTHILNMMLSDGLWIAKQIDASAHLI
jgi:hypothetical protein